MGYYVAKVDPEKKVLTIDDSVKPNSRDQLLIDTYIKAGYTLRFKSDARTKKAKERAAQKPSIAEITKTLKEFPDLEKEFETIKKGKEKGHGVFAAKSWYEKTAAPEIEKRKGKK